MFSTVLVVAFGVLGCMLSFLTGMGIPHAVAEWWALLGIGASAWVCLGLLGSRVAGGTYWRFPLMVSFAISFMVGLMMEIASSALPVFPVLAEAAPFIVWGVVLVGWWVVALRRIIQRRRDDGNYW